MIPSNWLKKYRIGQLVEVTSYRDVTFQPNYLTYLVEIAKKPFQPINPISTNFEGYTQSP